MRKDLLEKINAEGMEVELIKEGLETLVRIKYNNQLLERKFKLGKKIKLKKENSTIVLSTLNATKKEKRQMKTIKSHISNMIKGLKEPWIYKLEICFSHFPIAVNIDKANKQLVIKNLFGERFPRYVELLDNVDVEIKGNIIEVRSSDKELAGKQAALIENATRITDKDRRIFQDGIWIIEKAGKPI